MSKSKNSNCCCKLVTTVVCMALTVVVGGIILWQFLPEESKASVQEGVQDIFNKTDGIPDLEIPDNPFDNSVPNDGYVFNQCDDDLSNCCNGLDSICDLRADEILYAGVHNAMATRDDGFLIGANHRLSLEKSLRSGYRAINIDMAKCDGELKLIHGTCSTWSRDPVEVFSNILSFVETNPTEVILLNMQIDEKSGGAQVPLDEIYSLMQSVEGFTSKMYSYSDPSTAWPTLRELIESRNQIIFFHYNGQTCRDGFCPQGAAFHDWFVYAGESAFQFREVADVRDTATACEITRGPSNANFFGINMFLTFPSHSAAEELNTLASLESQMNACSELNASLDVNVIFVDFWSVGNLPELVQTENSKRANAAMRKELR